MVLDFCFLSFFASVSISLHLLLSVLTAALLCLDSTRLDLTIDGLWLVIVIEKSSHIREVEKKRRSHLEFLRPSPSRRQKSINQFDRISHLRRARVTQYEIQSPILLLLCPCPPLACPPVFTPTLTCPSS
ncbi:hypothetical protein GGI42DRAFT_18263 [Trichoderma sp. SZMC 28013]